MNDHTVLASCDIVVVGGGIAGLSSAFELRRRGFDVVVVEQRFTAFGASGRNPGAAWVQFARTGTELALARAGKAKLVEYLAEIGDVFEFREQGGLFFFETEEQGAVMDDYIADRRAAGVEVELVTVAEARKIAPILPETAIGAVYCDEDAQIDSQGFVAALSAACTRRGVRIFQNTTVLSTIRSGSSVAGVRTVRGEIRASGVVWATGAWVAGLPAEEIVVPVRTTRMGQLLTQPLIASPSAVLHGPRGVDLCGGLQRVPSFRPEFFESPRSRRHDDEFGYDDVITQNREGALVLGHSIDAAGSLNPHISLDATQAMISTTLDRYPAHGGLGVTGLWAGLASNTADGLPIVDRVDGVFVNVGHVWGVTSGPIGGQTIAEIIAGETSPFTEALSVDRSDLETEIAFGQLP